MNIRHRKETRLKGIDYSMPNAAYFVICGFVDALPSAVRAKLYDAILIVASEVEYELEGAVVMPDHLHLLLHSPDAPQHTLSDMMCALKSKALYLLKKEGVVTSSFWKRNFHDHVIRNENDWFEIMSYIVSNPVKAGLCDKSSDYPLLYVSELSGSLGATQGRPVRE